MKFNKREIMVFVGIAIIFILLRLPGIHLPLHQDEYKWPTIVNPALTAPGGVPHPPLGEFIYRTAGETVGYNNFRLVPFFFGFLNLILIYFIVRRRYSSKAAQWSALFFTFSYYSVLASLMVDTDGQILPFFFLLSLWFYDSFDLGENKKKWLWLGLFFVSIALGMLVKMSFILAIGAFVLDFLIEKEIFKDKKKLAKAFGFGVLGIVLLTALLYFSKFVFPFFNLGSSVKYWEGFAKGFNNRNFFQTGIQFAKAVLYLSPALVLAGLLSLFPYRKDLKLFHIFLGLGLVFYLVLFDFSTGALDRYLQFMIVPLCIISGAVFVKVFENKETKLEKNDFISIFIISASIFALQFFNHFVPPLHPKAEWLNRLISLKWNFLFPFSGGSGPLGFYVSFLFMALIWICSAIFTASFLKMKNVKKRAAFCILVLGILYNGVFIEEYLFGKINGSAPKLVYAAAEFIKNDPDIKKVTVYNDNGGDEIMKIGKYRRRLYTDPAFNLNDKVSTLNATKDYYLEINIPRIDPGSVYRKFFDSCKIVYNRADKSISAKVYDCRGVPDIKLN
jgi:hypothetical protein